MRELIWRVITGEENLSKTYQQLARQTAELDLRRQFRQLAEEHAGHAAQLRKLITSGCIP